MKTYALLPIFTFVACGSRTPTANAPGAAEPTTETHAAMGDQSAIATDPASPATTAPATTEPEYVPTDVTKLKKVSKADLSVGQKLAKESDPWDTAFAAIQKKLGPPTFKANGTDDPEALDGDTYYWTAMRRDGGCDKLYVTMSADQKSVFEIGLTANGKDAYTVPDKGGPMLNPCTGQQFN